MKNFKWGKFMKSKQKTKPRKDDKQVDKTVEETIVEENKPGLDVAVALQSFELVPGNNSLDVPKLTVAGYRSESPVSMRGNIEDFFHVTLSEDECQVCNWRKGRKSVLESKPCDSAEILPADFIASVDKQLSGLIPVEECLEIRTAVLEDIKTQYPSYYDFCVISSDDDYPRAHQFRLLVSNSFSLTGCMLNDGFLRLGSDIFEAYETMIDHCSKVFFFITQSFNANNFCRRLQSGTIFTSLMSRAKTEHQKCVPVFPDGPCRPPLALSGIAGIVPRNHDLLHQSMNTTYTIAVKNHLALMNQRNNELRAIRYLELFQKSIEDRKQQRESLEDRIAEVKSSSVKMLQPSSSPMVGYNVSAPISSNVKVSEISSPSALRINNSESQFQSASVEDSHSVLFNSNSQSKQNISNFDNEPSGSDSKESKPKLKTKSHCESLVNKVLSELKSHRENYFNKTYNFNGGNVQVGDNITIHVYSQQNSSFMDFSGVNSPDNESGEEESNADHSDTSSQCSDSDSDVNSEDVIKSFPRKLDKNCLHSGLSNESDSDVKSNENL